jgi:hypothetical protein
VKQGEQKGSNYDISLKKTDRPADYDGSAPNVPAKVDNQQQAPAYDVKLKKVQQ